MATKSTRILISLTLCLLGLPVFGIAQQTDDPHLADHRPLMNPVWEAFNELAYEEVFGEAGSVIYKPYFSRNLRKLNGKTVSIQGYMIPKEPVRHHEIFLLSVLPVFQCMFCGKDGIPPMVQIILANGNKLQFTQEPLTIRGVVFLNTNDDGATEIQLRDAVFLPAGDM